MADGSGAEPIVQHLKACAVPFAANAAIFCGQIAVLWTLLGWIKGHESQEKEARNR